MKTVNLFTNALVWNCPECELDNIAVMQRANIDLDDPEHAELREQLMEDGELFVGDDDDDDDDDDGGYEFDADALNLVLYYPPPTVKCGACGEMFRTETMTVDESHSARQWVVEDDDGEID